MQMDNGVGFFRSSGGAVKIEDGGVGGLTDIVRQVLLVS